MSSERFQLGRLLGRGGMGDVYEAYEADLGRHVALKLLRGDDPAALARFLREAQAQARVDHENVCKVYEVGELDGKRYIAMQLISGEPLFVADGESPRPSPTLLQMTVEQKVRIMQKVAEGIQAAHRQGLIHRDVKPTNVMLETTADGDFKPYVLDFGLAREVAATGVTSHGLAAGTPNYMAPEQARGEAGALDRRTDVYGLGATLFAVLAGKPPFEGPSSLDVLVKVTEAEPEPLRGVPEDLAIIVAKCLRKEPAQRYESARAVAEDLGRYLGGEPILARPAGLSYRLLKKARKHRRLVAVGAVTLAAFLVLGTVSLQGQLRARERARLAAAFGQEVKAIETRMRIAFLIPEHDITPEREAIRRRMKAIETQMAQIGGVAQGPGHYALGRGYLVLRDYAKAREHLDAAWREGYRELEVSYALGEVMSALYQKELEAAERIADDQEREQRKREVAKAYRDPALAHLRRSRGLEVESPEYVEALVALNEKRYDEAIRKAQAAYARLPWLHEAQTLEATTYRAMGDVKRDEGKPQEAAEAYRRAVAAHRAALVTGRSDPAIPAGMCRLAQSRMTLELYYGGGTVEPLFHEGLAACEQALRIEGESADTYMAKAVLLWEMAEAEIRQSPDHDPRVALAQSIAASRQALRLRPEDAAAYFDIGNALRLRARYEVNHGMDSNPSCEESIRNLAKAVEIDSNDATLHNALGLAYLEYAENELRHGRDPRELLRKAERSLESTLAFKSYPGTLINLGFLRLTRARYALDHGEDPRGPLAAALEINDILVEDPQDTNAWTVVARAHLLRGEYQLLTGGDPRESLAKALAAYRGLFTIAPRQVSGLAWCSQLYEVFARFELEQGRNPLAMIAQGRQWAQKALQSDSSNMTALREEARLTLVEGRWRMGRSLSPLGSHGRAQRALQQALRVKPDDPQTLVLLAEVEQWQTHWRRSQGQPVGPEIARGLAAVERAIAIQPDNARAFAVRGALYLEQARPGSSDRPELLAKARDSLARALAINRHLTREYGPLLDRARAEAGPSGPR